MPRAVIDFVVRFLNAKIPDVPRAFIYGILVCLIAWWATSRFEKMHQADLDSIDQRFHVADSLRGTLAHNIYTLWRVEMSNDSTVRARIDAVTRKSNKRFDLLFGTHNLYYEDIDP